MVGYTLRQERERQNLTIEDIEQGTSIRALYIEAIENGEYDKLPGTVYTKGFIKNYAKFLGLDADAMTKEFANDLLELSGTPQTPTTEENPEKKSEPQPVKPEKKPLGYSVQEKNRSKSGMLIIAAVVLIAALAGGAWSWLSSSGEEVAKVEVDNPSQQIQPADPVQTADPIQPADPVQPADNPEPVANANSVPKTEGVAIQARFNDKCWLLVTVDGAVVQEGVIDGGQTLSWEGKEQINFRLGNAGAVEFFQDGKSLGVQGAVGDVVDKTFTRS